MNNKRKDLAKKIANSLGQPKAFEGHSYTVKPYAGKWWIEHDGVGSGEPVEQWLDTELKGHVVSRSKYQEAIEENKRLKADIEAIVNGNDAEKINEIVESWANHFEKERRIKMIFKLAAIGRQTVKHITK